MKIADLKNTCTNLIENNTIYIESETIGLKNVGPTLSNANINKLPIFFRDEDLRPQVLQGAVQEKTLSSIFDKQPSAEVLAFTGSTSLLNLENLKASVYFTPINGNIEFFVVVDLPQSWKLAYSFPNISKHSRVSPEQLENGPFTFLSEEPPLFLNELQFSTSRFILSSYQHADDEGKVLLKKGLNLATEFTLTESDQDRSSPLDVVRTLFATQQRWALNGAIEFKGDYPQVDLTAEMPEGEELFKAEDSSFGLGDIQLRFYSQVTGDEHPYITSGVFLGCAVKAGEATMRLESELKADGDRLDLRGEFEGVRLPGLPDMAQLIGGGDLSSSLPANFKDLPSLEIKRFALSIAPEEPSIDYVSIVSQLVKGKGAKSPHSSWVLVDPWLQVEDVFLELEAFSPFRKAEREIVFSIYGGINLVGGVIDISAMGPDFEISGNLEDDQKIDFEKLVNEIASNAGVEIEIPKPANQAEPLAVTGLGFYAHPSNNYYSFDMAISNALSVKLFNGEPFLFKEAEFELTLDNGAPSSRLAAVFAFADTEFFTIASIPGGAPWSFEGGLQEGSSVSFNTLLADLYELVCQQSLPPLPAGFPELFLDDVDFTVTTNGALSFKSASRVKSTLPIRMKDCSFNMAADINYGPAKDKRQLTGTLAGDLTIGNVAFDAEFNLGDPALSLKLGEGRKLNFKEVAEFFLGEELFSSLPENLTDNLQGVEVTQFYSEIDFASKGISLETSATFKDIKLGTDDLLIARADIGLKLDISDSKQYCKIAVGGKGHIGPAILFEDCRFLFEYDQRGEQADWTLGGLFDAEVLGHELRVEASYQVAAGTKTMALQARDPFPAIVFPGVGSFELDDFMLKVKKAEGEKVVWGLSTTFQLSTEAEIFDLRSGTVGLVNEADKAGLRLLADGIDMRIPEPYLPWFSLDKPELELTYDKTGKQWSCLGRTGFVAHEVPDVLTRAFPTGEVFTECTINDQKAEFSVCLEDGLIEIPAPPDLDHFGNAYFGIREMKVDLMKGGSLTAKLALGLPKGLNAFFQPDPKAEDKLEIFRVYAPDISGVENDLIGLDLSISAERGLVCELDQSPFKFFEITEDAAGKKILDIDLKEFGQITVEVPVFSLKPGGSLSAAGGFDIKRELQFPLTPFKYLFKQLGLEEVSTALPTGIPIRGVEFYSEEKGFHCDAFFELFVANGDQVPIPEWLKEGFGAIEDIANKLPADFLQYGNVEIPRHVHFDADFTADGSLKFQFSVKDPEKKDEAIPLKLLLPAFPNFVGVELYSIAFGELFGGALLRLDLDAKIDTFDLPSLLASLLIPYDELSAEVKAVLADPRRVRNSFRAKNLMVAIIYQAAGIPIPIPLFYDELNVSYSGLDGFELESCFKFPKPELDLKNVGVLFGEIGKFFGQGEDIDTEKLEKITLGDYTIGANYIRFPKYVSTEEEDPTAGKLLGTQQGFTIKPVLLIGGLLNAIKNGSINELIQVVEVERRVGEIDLKIFEVLQLHCEYALTTPFEFVDYAFKKLSSFDQGQARQYIEILPPKRTGLPAQKGGECTYSPVTEDTEGLVLFLKGNLDIAGALKFDTGFGLVATGAGFGMGMQFNGKLADISDVHMRGLVAIKKDGSYLLEGDSYLKILDQNILTGAFCFSNDLFRIEAKAGDGPIRVEGLLEGEFTNDKFHLEGQTTLALFGLTADGRAKFLITDNEQQVYLGGKVEVGKFVCLEARFASYADMQRAGMQLFLQGNLSTLLDMTLDAEALVAPDRALQAKGTASMAVLEQEIISAKVGYAKEVLTFDGYLDLFPGNDLMLVEGKVAGTLADKGFGLSGACNMALAGCTFADTMVKITDREFAFAAMLFKQKALLLMVKQDPGFSLYGTMSPIVLGGLLEITCAPGAAPISQYDLGGPSIYVSTSPKSPGFRLNGRVSLLGIQSSTDIFFNQDGFYFNVSGNVFNAVEGSISVLGRDFNDSNNILIRGTIEAGDFQMKAIATINEAAKSIDEQMKNYDKELEEKKRYLEKQQQKVSGLNREIKKCKNQIGRLKRQIKNKKAWYNSRPWWEKPGALVVLGAFVVARGAEIAALYATIGVLETAKLAALGVLEIAKAALSGVQLALKGARAVTYALADFSKGVLTFTGNLLTIHSATFESQLNSICGGSTAMNFDVTFLGERYKLDNLRFNLLQPQVGVDSLVAALKNKSA